MLAQGCQRHERRDSRRSRELSDDTHPSVLIGVSDGRRSHYGDFFDTSRNWRHHLQMGEGMLSRTILELLLPRKKPRRLRLS